MLESKRRIKLPLRAGEWRATLIDADVIELAIDGAIAISAIELRGLPADSADRLIVATALAHNARLMTADRRLLAWPGPLERIDARR